jgi:hypothetical protein
MIREDKTSIDGATAADGGATMIAPPDYQIVRINNSIAAFSPQQPVWQGCHG